MAKHYFILRTRITMINANNLIFGGSMKPSESYECANVTCDSMQLKQIKLKVWNDSLTRRHTQQGSGVRRKITKSENIKNKV